MSVLKPISGHGNLVDNHCRDYLLGLGKWEHKYHGKRCKKITYIRIASDEAGKLNWDERMDLQRRKYGTDEPKIKDNVRTYNHYIFSPDPKDNISIDELDEAIKKWAERVFLNKFSIVIGYHDDNTNNVQHAHMYINNVNFCTSDKYRRIGGYVTPQCWEFANQLWQYMCEERGWHSFIDKQIIDTEIQKLIDQGIYNEEIEHISEDTERLFDIDKEYFKNIKYFSHDIDYRRPYAKIKSVKGKYFNKPPFSSKDGRKYTKSALEAKSNGNHLWTDDIRDLIEISYYQSNNIMDFVKYLTNYDIKVEITKDKDFKFTHPEKETWVVTGKKLGNDYRRDRIVNLFNKQDDIEHKPNKPSLSQNLKLTKQIREIGYTISKQHISYIDSKTQLTLTDLAKTMRICSFFNCWSKEDFTNLDITTHNADTAFAIDTISKLESLNNIRDQFETENPIKPRSYADIEHIPKETLQKNKQIYREKILKSIKKSKKRGSHKEQDSDIQNNNSTKEINKHLDFKEK